MHPHCIRACDIDCRDRIRAILEGGIRSHSEHLRIHTRTVTAVIRANEGRVFGGKKRMAGRELRERTRELLSSCLLRD